MEFLWKIQLLYFILTALPNVGSVHGVTDNSVLIRDQRLRELTSWSPRGKGFLHKFVLNSKVISSDQSPTKQDDQEALTRVSTLTLNQCHQDIETTIQAYKRKEQWALQMYDSLGKVGSGVLHRALRYWGDYDGCLSVESNQTFQTSYCLAKLFVWKMDPFAWKTPQYMELGLCVPSSCDNETVTTLLNLYFFKQTNISAMTLTSVCQERSLPLTTGAIVVLVVCSLIALIMLISTLYDVFGTTKCWVFSSSGNDNRRDNEHAWQNSNGQQNQNSVIETSDQEPILVMARKKRHQVLKRNRHMGVGAQLLLAFSVVRNGSKLLSTSTNHKELLCLNGLRVFSMIFILFGHVTSGLVKLSNNGLRFLQITKENYSYYLSFGFMCVDTFFVLSGMLVVYSIMPWLKARGVRIRFLASAYLLRYLRLTPPYLLVLVTYTQLFKYFADGPVWLQNGLDQGKCYEFPWNNFLYINNFLSIGPWCMNWSWYLAVDMQYFAMFPIVVLPLYYFDWRGLCVPVLLTIGSSLAAGLISYNHDLLPYMDPMAETTRSHDYMTLLYLKPYTRYGPYAIGMVLGYILEKYRCRARLSKTVTAVGWILSFLGLFTVIFAIHVHENYAEMSREVAALYNALSKPIWGLGIGWIIFACSTGYGGPANAILSWKFFSPCGRLTYMVYLIHLVIINYYFFALKESMYQNGILTLYFHGAGFWAISYILAFIFTLAFEAPFGNIFKLANQRRGKQLQSIEESRM